LKGYYARYPKKSAEEYLFVDRILARLNELIEEDSKLISMSQVDLHKHLNGAAVTPGTTEQIQNELQEDQPPLYYQSAAKETIDKWKKMSPEEKKKHMKGDAVDEVNTTDMDVSDESEEDLPTDFWDLNRINLARAFLGYDGGYSIRKIKKFFKRYRDA
jgi:hypothetical protein